MKKTWLSCATALLVVVFNEAHAVNPRVRRESSQGFGFLEKVGAVMDPALSDPYAPRVVKEAAAQRLSDSYRNIQDKQSAIDTALKRSSEPLKMPKCGLVSAADIRNYPLVEKYLTLDDPEISHYFIVIQHLFIY